MCRNILTAALAAFYNEDRKLPTGKNLIDAEPFVLDRFWEHKNKDGKVENIEDDILTMSPRPCAATVRRVRSRVCAR